jgi:superfamily II DNA/RNA helicase
MGHHKLIERHGAAMFASVFAFLPWIDIGQLCVRSENMGLSIPVLKAIKRKGFQLPTPIQRKNIPLIMQGADVVGMAMTGSGKTGAFVIPIVNKCAAELACLRPFSLNQTHTSSSTCV